MNKITMWKLKNWMFRVTHPSFWFQNEPTCWEWDKALNALLDCNPEIEIDNISEFRCKLNGVGVWIGNYPYSFGNMHTITGIPAPLTRLRLKRRIDNLRKQRDLTAMHQAVEDAINRRN